MKNKYIESILLTILTVVIIGCDRDNNTNLETDDEKCENMIEYQEIEIESQCVWDSLIEEDIYIINSLEELAETFTNCGYVLNDSILNSKTLILFKGTATSSTMISEVSFDIYSNDNSNFILQIDIVGSVAQTCDSRTVYFSVLIDKMENIETFVPEYKNIDCFE
jgi:hypothetical protein